MQKSNLKQLFILALCLSLSLYRRRHHFFLLFVLSAFRTHENLRSVNVREKTLCHVICRKQQAASGFGLFVHLFISIHLPTVGSWIHGFTGWQDGGGIRWTLCITYKRFVLTRIRISFVILPPSSCLLTVHFFGAVFSVSLQITSPPESQALYQASNSHIWMCTRQIVFPVGSDKRSARKDCEWVRQARHNTHEFRLNNYPKKILIII